MAISHTYTLGWQKGSDSISKSYVMTAENETNIDVDIPNSVSNYVVAMNLTNSMIKGLFLNAAYQVELRTNSNSSPGNTYTMKSDRPLLWTTDFVLSNPFTTNVTDFRFYNTSGTSSRVQGSFLYDGTP